MLDAVPKHTGAEPVSIARTAGISVARTKEALGALHRVGLVEHALGRWRLTPDDPDGIGRPDPDAGSAVAPPAPRALRFVR